MVWNPFITSIDRALDYRPPPPKLPEYDPHEDVPKWSFTRLSWNLPVDKGPIKWTEIGTQPKSPDEPDWRGIIRNNVIEYKMPEEYKFGLPNSLRYFWFDTPDYADPFKKLWYSFKWFTVTGYALLWARAIFENRKPTLPNAFLLTRLVFFPWLFAGLSASALVVTVSNLRGKKDDYYNYALAGLLFGSILGRKDHAVFFKYTVLSIPAALIIKHNAETNGLLAPFSNPRMQYWGLSGFDAEHGMASGDFRFGIRGTLGDPGRDVRKPY